MFTKLLEALKATRRTIVFTEGPDARILEAADRLIKDDLMDVILIGNVDEVKAAAAKGGFDIAKAEIIDPATGEVLPEGSKGELVFTSITKEAFPLLRYRTRDICVLSREQCSCGRTFVKMSKPMGRSDDMMIIRGVNVFPSQIETVLLNQGLTSNYQIIVDRVNNSDTLDVNVEMTPEMFADSVGTLSQQEKALKGALKSMLGIQANVHLVEPKSITRSEGKAVRVIDRRKLY